jgi:hypothetical protein
VRSRSSDLDVPGSVFGHIHHFSLQTNSSKVSLRKSVLHYEISTSEANGLTVPDIHGTNNVMDQKMILSLPYGDPSS